MTKSKTKKKILDVKNLHVHYGAIHAIKGVDFEVHEGEIITLIGSNGAGKTTILRTLSGILEPSNGSIELEGTDIIQVPGHKIPAMGMSQVPEGRRVFATMTVLENLQMGAFSRTENTIAEDLERVYKSFPRLKERLSQPAGTLSGGEQQMLAMGRALMSRPKLMLLDEPSMGLAPILVDEIFNIIEEINKQGTTILLVEQNANRALHIADRAYVLETGKILTSGDAKDLLEDPKVIEAYLSA